MDTFQSFLRFQLVVADVVQVRHWFKSRSYNEHILLDNLYSAIRSGADQIAEYVSESGEQDRTIVSNPTEITEFYKNIEAKTILELIEGVRRAYSTMRNAKHTDSTFASLIDELDKFLVEISYQLKQEYRNIKAKRATNVTAKKKTKPFIQAVSSFQEVARDIERTLKQLRMENTTTVLPIKQDNLFVITYDGNSPDKASDKIITTLENNLDADWVVYLEDIESKLAIIHCEKN